MLMFRNLLLKIKTALPIIQRSFPEVHIKLHCDISSIDLIMILLLPFQVTLGICTLLYYVPTKLAASHQSGSLALLTFALWFMHEIRKVPK